MIIANGIDVHLEICDAETTAEFTHIGCFNPDTKIWTDFEFSIRVNDLYRFVKWYTSNPCDYLVTFNGISFDQQIFQYIVKNYERWYDLDGVGVAKMVYLYVQKVIDNMNYNIRPAFTDDKFSVKAMDLFKIHHFDNEAKMTSLKWCAFMMNMDVETMPYDHTLTGMTDEQMDETISYEHNDIIVTLGLLYVTIGQPEKVMELNGGFSVDELMDYKGANKLQMRFDIMAETGLKCLNWSDVKIGEEMNKANYMSAKGIKNEWDLIPKKVKHPYGSKFKNYFPPTVDFQTEPVKQFVKELGEKSVLSEKQEFPIKIGNTTYTIAKGGIHSTEKNRKIVPVKGHMLRDADVGAQYPNSIIKLGVYPPHLDPIILIQFQETVKLKDHYKGLGKEAKEDDKKLRLKSLEGSTKLQMNGGYYGKLGQPGSFLEYPEGVLKVTMGNQLEILMLVEMLEVKGFSVVSGNTDGIVTYFSADRVDEYLEICKQWEKKVGNDVLGKLEYADFAGLWQESINSYIGKKVDGSVKKKGRFVTTYGNPGCELNKNKSKRIIPMALEAYFIEGKDPIQFIKNHNNIFDFCIAKKAYGDLHYEELLLNNQVKVYKKLVRYFVSKNGNVFKKRGINQEGDPMDNYCEAPHKTFFWLGEPKLTYFNKAFKADDYNIDYDFYIIQTLERIDKIEKTKKAISYADSKKPQIQTSLF